MSSAATTVPVVIVALILVLFSIGEDPAAVLVFQNGVPATVVSISESRSPQGPVYSMSFTQVGADESVILLAEPSDVAGSTYLIHEAGQVPQLISLAPVLSGLAAAGDPAIREISIAEDSDVNTGSTLYLVRDGGATLLTSPETGLTVLVTE
jgi:small ligand-binding sensory domain FIST